MKMSMRLSDLVLIWISCYYGSTENPLVFLLVPVVISSWFFNPRWNSRDGWRFKP